MPTTDEKSKKEGSYLLGSPTFTELENGRFKCVETGHELLAKDKDSYSQSKKCRLGLIDFSLSHNKPPLNMFKQDPLSRSKLICKLTGDTINKSEEHIWKHMSGKRFLNKLEQKEEEKLSCNTIEQEESEQKPSSADGGKERKKKKNKDKEAEQMISVRKTKKNIDKEAEQMISERKKKKNKDKEAEQIISEVRNSTNEESNAEEEDFWIPPVGDRWDFDDGGERWGSGTESEEESEGDMIDGAADEDCKESEELTTRTKRMSLEIGPSSFASRKKKSKKNYQS